MKKISRFIVLVSSVLTIGAFFFPLWKVTLIAPQYPEGLRLYIWASKLKGGTWHDIDDINVLNHYIGMQFIHPNAIPELHIVPYILGFLVVIGLATVILNKKFMLYIYAILYLLVAVIGLGDFYRWEYNYGHNLNPDAPVKIPGMSYQPPLIGTKQLLNITASSYPVEGGLFLIIAGAILWLALLYEFTSRSGPSAKSAT